MTSHRLLLRDLRIQLLQIADDLQELSLKLRQDSSQDYARKINDIQIKIGRVIGDSMTTSSSSEDDRG